MLCMKLRNCITVLSFSSTVYFIYRKNSSNCWNSSYFNWISFRARNWFLYQSYWRVNIPSLAAYCACKHLWIFWSEYKFVLESLISLCLCTYWKRRFVECKIELMFSRHNSIFKDVYREVGILEVFVTCLQQFSAKLKESGEGSGKRDGEFMYLFVLYLWLSFANTWLVYRFSEVSAGSEQEKLGLLVIEALITLLNGNNNNATIFRESGGAKCALSLVVHADCRHQALGMMFIDILPIQFGEIQWLPTNVSFHYVFKNLTELLMIVIRISETSLAPCFSPGFEQLCLRFSGIFRELMLNGGGDDDMGTLLAMMHSSPADALVLKGHILKVCTKTFISFFEYKLYISLRTKRPALFRSVEINCNNLYLSNVASSAYCNVYGKATELETSSGKLVALYTYWAL